MNRFTFVLQNKKILLANINVILSMVGYEAVTTLLSDFMGGNTQAVTIPYRIFSLFIAIIIILSFKKGSIKLNAPLKALFLYWGMLSLRFIFDTQINPSAIYPSDRINQIALFMFCLTIIPMIAMLVSYSAINFDFTLYGCYILSSLSIVYCFFTNTAFQEAVVERIEGNSALNTISTGQMGLTNLILGFIIFFKVQKKLILRLVIVGISIIAIFIWLRAGSRGPILAFMLVVAFYLFSKAKTITKGALKLIILIGVAFFALHLIENWLDSISPILKHRLFERSDMTSDRDPLYYEAFNTFLQNPILGKTFALMVKGDMTYPHNIFIESLMQLGIVGFSVLMYVLVKAFRIIYSFIHNNSNNKWIGLLAIQQFSSLLVSGTFAMSSQFSIALVLILLSKRYLITNKSYLKLKNKNKK